MTKVQPQDLIDKFFDEELKNESNKKNIKRVKKSGKSSNK